MRHHLHLISKMRERGWKDEELDYARHVMSNAHVEKSQTSHLLDTTLLWFFLIVISLGNIFIITAIMPLLVLFPNPAIYGVLILLGTCFGILTKVVLKDIEHLFTGHHLYILYVLIPFIAATGGLVVLTYAQAHLPNIFFLYRSPLKMSIIYTIFFIAPLAISKLFRFHSTKAVKKEVL